MVHVIWTNFAISELKNIVLYYRLAASNRVAEQIRKSIFNATRVLVKQALSGRLEENLEILQEGHRYIVAGNYKIIYRIIGSDVYITDVFDCRQNPKKITKRARK